MRLSTERVPLPDALRFGCAVGDCCAEYVSVGGTITNAHAQQRTARRPECLERRAVVDISVDRHLAGSRVDLSATGFIPVVLGILHYWKVLNSVAQMPENH